MNTKPEDTTRLFIKAIVIAGATSIAGLAVWYFILVLSH